MANSKFFRVFVEGFTATDGRQIDADWIDQIVANYNPATYTARINCEHIKGYSPEPPFNAYGDVTAVRAQTDEIVIEGKTEKRRALYAQIAPNDQLLSIVAKGQKIFTSVEITPDFAGTGKFGLVGLAITDNPASLGTEALNFAALKPMFDARKTHPNNLFTASVEAKIELEDAAAAPADPTTGAFTAMAAFFAKLTGATAAAPAQAAAAPAGGADLQEGLRLMSASITALGGKLDTSVGAIRTELGTLKGQLEGTELPGFKRQPATGGDASGRIVTDC